MEELKEIRFNGINIILKNNIVKSSILPEKVNELDRNISVEENSIIEGAVYANKIEVKNGESEFKGAVFTKLELYINSEATGAVTFRKSVGSSGTIASRALNCKPTFLSDINAQKVSLTNSFIAGSIYADEISLDNCVVIGGVFATQNLDVNNSIVGTFNSPTVKVSEQLMLLLPSAFSIEQINSLFGTKMYNLCLADLGSLYKGDEQAENSGKIEMSVESDELKTILVDKEIQKTLRSYSVIGKVLAADLLDTDKFQNHFLLTAASLGNQTLKSYDLGIDKNGESVKLEISKIRDFFFNILSGKIEIQDINGEFSIEEITSRFN